MCHCIHLNNSQDRTSSLQWLSSTAEYENHMFYRYFDFCVSLKITFKKWQNHSLW